MVQRTAITLNSDPDLEVGSAVLRSGMSIKNAIRSMPLIGPLARSIARPFSRHGSVGYSIATLRKLRGVHARTCTVCNYHGKFRAFGDPPRWDARCPSCGSLERHRLFALLLKQRPGLVRGRLIHFAPEPNIAALVKPLADQYQSADLFMSGCDLALNLEQIDLADGGVDVFLASHVLEHVNDHKALPELRRCLRAGGLAIIMVPIVEGWTESYENDEVTTERDRELHFGQFDHVRYYGRDIRDRITDAGFDLEEFTASPAECIEFGLARGETVFLATRPA